MNARASTKCFVCGVRVELRETPCELDHGVCPLAATKLLSEVDPETREAVLWLLGGAK